MTWLDNLLPHHHHEHLSTPELIHLIIELQEHIMAGQAELAAAITPLQDAVNALAARVAANVAPDLTPQIDQVNALTAQVNSIDPATPPAA